MITKTRLPAQWVWLILALALMAIALLRVMAHHDGLKAWLGADFLLHVSWVSSVGVALVVAVLAVLMRAERETWAHRKFDRAFLWLVLSWVISSVGVALMALSDNEPWTISLRHLAYQVSVAATLNFLRCCMTGPTRSLRWMIWAQLGAGLMFLLWSGFLNPSEGWPVDMWRIGNVLGFTAIFLVMSHSLFTASHYPPWLTLGACLMGFGLGLSDMASIDGSGIPVTPMHSVFSAYLLMLWLLLSNRVGRFSVNGFGARGASENSILGGEFAQSSLFFRVDNLDTTHPPSALTNVRRRIAQDLHDGVGSQLVTLIASLDRNVPQQKEMARALEECLLDVKMLGDGIDDSGESVLEALGRLRYRVQHSLDRLNIGLVWDLNASPALDALVDERVRQVLRIVQEALANVMRHSRATTVEVSCGYVPETEALMVFVADDGAGIDEQRMRERSGKGLEGMRRRAEAVHGVLEITSEPGKGTMVRLMMPISAGPGPTRPDDLGPVQRFESLP